MQKLLDAIEQAGYAAWSENSQDHTDLLTDSSEWRDLQQAIFDMKAWAIEAKKAIDLLTERVEGAKL